jgi:hypothetical protein
MKIVLKALLIFFITCFALFSVSLIALLGASVIFGPEQIAPRAVIALWGILVSFIGGIIIGLGFGDKL